MLKISTHGILIAVFIGIVFGLKMQDDQWVQHAVHSDQSIARTVLPVAMAQSEETMEQQISIELARYIEANFNFTTIKTHWAQYIKEYDVVVDKQNILLLIRTDLPAPGSNSSYMLNAVQGFAKSRLPEEYTQGRIIVFGQGGKKLTEREFSR
ncbi:hypothetical protein JQN58_13945 [Aneurinibacillus sp. BA2021]|nr:hypothetical protein [Aneurinibacillus sp. BA2021]